MSAMQLETLLEIVGPHLQRLYVVREPISSAERLILTLRYFASGDSMTSMSFQYLVGLTTVSEIISSTCKIIWDQLCPLVLPRDQSGSPPTIDEQKWKSIAQDFNDLWDFPHCIGAIDGKHVTIQCPNNAGSNFYNYKNSHSIVLLAICDAHYNFLFVDIGAYGRRSNGGVFKESIFGQKFEANTMKVPKEECIYAGGPLLPYCLVRDEAFPLKPYLLRPYPRGDKKTLNADRHVYNYRLSRARWIIENVFRILASQWRIYRKPIIASVNTTSDLLDKETTDGVHILSSWKTIIENGCAFTDVFNCGTHNSTRQAIRIGELFCQYFNNEGAVPWQWDQ
ncbi:Putative nuclease HARBI1 [Trachymyrmex cornetzi]|uniref:Putative nuclease HARBI1 n=1 Tax=Trachymyrmex cornetzi TaxID=471704 RepID=A0A151ITJ4_9HYME|nr:Putative nuclease HARBI1 [Trachymyrmex cornetzi]